MMSSRPTHSLHAGLVRVPSFGFALALQRTLPDEEDDFDFAERFTSLKATFEAQLKEEALLNKSIANNLAKIQIVE